MNTTCLVNSSTVHYHYPIEEALVQLEKLRARRSICLLTINDGSGGWSRIYVCRHNYGIGYYELFHSWKDYTETYRHLEEGQFRNLLMGLERADVTTAAPGWQDAQPVWTDSPFPSCSHCSTQLPVLNLGRQHFSYCDHHKFVVHVGENLLSGWRDESLEEQQEQVSLRAYYRRIPSARSHMEVAVREVVDLPF